MHTVIETPAFIASAARVWSEGERIEFITWIAEHPFVGNVIPESGGLRKVRWARKGMGKRGGVRVIYYLQFADGVVVLLLVYSKSKFDTLRPEVLRKLKEQFHEG